ncbi:MAG: hypothetical protein J6Y48_14205 [Clostridia bacterium]|nr:hypothetical protein [Clostridia bacterium]
MKNHERQGSSATSPPQDGSGGWDFPGWTLLDGEFDTGCEKRPDFYCLQSSVYHDIIQTTRNLKTFASLNSGFELAGITSGFSGIFPWQMTIQKKISDFTAT